MQTETDILEAIQKDSVPPEKVFKNLNSLNKFLERNIKENILHVNISSLQANYNKLIVFLESLKVKPTIIICSETWVL